MSETIRVSKQVKRELSKIVGELQIERGEEVDFNGVIVFLLCDDRFYSFSANHDKWCSAQPYKASITSVNFQYKVSIVSVRIRV